MQEREVFDTIEQCDNLKPCPFCGGSPLLHLRRAVYPFSRIQKEYLFWKVECKNCGARTYWNHKENAISVWNNRKGNDKTCPSCGWPDRYSHFRILQWKENGSWKFQAECNSCSLSGPLASTEAEARALWDKRNTDYPRFNIRKGGEKHGL